VKAKIRDAGIPYSVPSLEELPERTRAVLAVLYLIFNEGYLGTDGEALIKVDLCEEAIRLARVLVELLPEDPEVQGLLALMLFTDARRDARTDANGDLVNLEHQNRMVWDAHKIEEGRAALRRCLQQDRPGPYQIQAAINAVHCEAADAAHTDWAQILALYDHLFALQPVALVALNRAVALAEVEGPARALEIVDGLAGLQRYHLYHAVRANLLVRLQREADAAVAYLAAIERATHPRERAYLEAQYRRLSRQ
jgi:RNA polymerase sigma-70 factor (ECF subfamily)